MRGQKDDEGIFVEGADFPGEGKPVHGVHLDIEKNNIITNPGFVLLKKRQRG